MTASFFLYRLGACYDSGAIKFSWYCTERTNVSVACALIWVCWPSGFGIHVVSHTRDYYVEFVVMLLIIHLGGHRTDTSQTVFYYDWKLPANLFVFQITSVKYFVQTLRDRNLIMLQFISFSIRLGWKLRLRSTSSVVGYVVAVLINLCFYCCCSLQ